MATNAVAPAGHDGSRRVRGQLSSKRLPSISTGMRRLL